MTLRIKATNILPKISHSWTVSPLDIDTVHLFGLRAPDYQIIVEKLIINEMKNYLIYLFKRFQSMLEEKCYAIQKVLLLQFTCFTIISPSRMSPSLKGEPQGGTMKKQEVQ